MEKSYKEKYEQAIERLKQWDREHPCDGYVLSDRDKFIFPELKESWDEKMRKAIKEALSSKQAEDIIESKYKIKMVDVSDWLEKQGQVKESTISQHEIETCKENDDSLTSENERIRKEIINYFRCQSEEEPIRKEIHNKWIAWLENVPVTIDNEKREGFHLGYKACLERQGEQEKDILEDAILDGNEDGLIAETIKYKHEKQDKQKLAENAKPQSSTPMSYGKELEKRMCEACNRFFAPNTDSNRYSASDLFYAGVKAERDLNTLTWSEEDVRVIDDIFYSINEESVTEGLNDRGIMYALKDIRGIVRYLRNWLQDLKRRVQPQPKQEWSEEDEQRLNSCLNILQPKTFVGNMETINTKWLRSLKGRVQPQNTWKPSDEQMEILLQAVAYFGVSWVNKDYLALQSLYFDLKKLKEGV